MSYFPDFVAQEKNEIADGVFVERRTVLKVSAFALGSMLLGFYLPLKAEITENTKLDEIDFQKFVTSLTPKAEALVKAEKPDEEAYLKEFTDMAKRIQGVKHAQKTQRKIKFTSMHNKMPIKIYQIRLLPGAALRFHDHRNYNGIVSLLEGSATIRHFDFAEKVKNVHEAKQFKLTETINKVFKAGDVGNLSQTRDNIHDIRAGKEGVLFLDIFTFFNDQGTSKYLKVEKKPIEKDKKIFLAEWE